MQSHQTQLTANKGLITPFCDSILENLSLTNQQKSMKYNQHYSALSKLILPCTCLILIHTNVYIQKRTIM